MSSAGHASPRISPRGRRDVTHAIGRPIATHMAWRKKIV